MKFVLMVLLHKLKSLPLELYENLIVSNIERPSVLFLI